MGAPLVTTGETSPSLAAIVASVEWADLVPPDIRERTSPDGMMTVAFTDLESSTAMMERLGEDRWLELLLDHNRLVREYVEAFRGAVVKSQGDGFMLVFTSAAASLAWAVDLQRVLDRYNSGNRDQRLRLRIGMHTGNLFRDGDDFLGKTVVLAARITGRARGGEILVSSALKSYTERLGLWRFGPATEVSLKGLATSQLVYALDWRSVDAKRPSQND